MNKTDKEKMLLCEPYIAFDPELNEMRRKTAEATMKFNTTGNSLYVEEIFMRSFDHLILNPPFYCDYGENVSIGHNVFINFNCSILSCAKVEIGDHCYIGPNVQMYTAIHPLDLQERNKAINMAKPIKIGANCWLGGAVIVLPGVEIGEGCTVGAGSVVTRNIPAYSVAAGNPCRVLKSLRN